MEGKATDSRPLSRATLRLAAYALSSKLGSSWRPSLYMGPTAWMTYLAFRLPPVVNTALPAGQTPIFLHSSLIAAPPALWMAPATPPPPPGPGVAAVTLGAGRPSAF